jgi:hypothetical protein
MDKAQKRLVDTYFRKRTIASNQGYDEFDFQKHELNYWYVHYPEEFKKLDYQQLPSEFVAKVLIDDPSVLKRFPMGLYMNGNDLGQVISKRPELIKLEPIQRILWKLQSYNVVAILLDHPELADDLKEVSLDDDDMMYLIAKHPKLMTMTDDYGKTRFNPEYFTDAMVAYILEKQPQLIKVFNYKKLIGSYYLHDLLKAQPQLAPYFK